METAPKGCILKQSLGDLYFSSRIETFPLSVMMDRLHKSTCIASVGFLPGHGCTAFIQFFDGKSKLEVRFDHF